MSIATMEYGSDPIYLINIINTQTFKNTTEMILTCEYQALPKAFMHTQSRIHKKYMLL